MYPLCTRPISPIQACVREAGKWMWLLTFFLSGLDITVPENYMARSSLQLISGPARTRAGGLVEVTRNPPLKLMIVIEGAFRGENGKAWS